MKILLALLLTLAFVSPVSAGQVDPSCSFSPNPVSAGQPVTVSAINLPIGIPFGVSTSPFPSSPSLYTTDGTWSRSWTASAPLTFYFWVRGHGPSLLKPGPQLNDYHVVAMCSLETV